MWFRRASLLAGAGLVEAAAGGCDGAGVDSGPPKIELDRATAASPARPASDRGLSAATPRQLWRADLPNVPSPAMAKVEPVAGQLVVVSPRGLDVLDGQSGKPRWHYYEKSRLVTDYAVTADAVVVTTVAANKNGKALTDDKRMRTTGLDAATGKTLWNKDDLQPVTEGHQIGYRPVASAKSGVAVFAGPDKTRSTLLGMDARTGKQRWTWSNGTAQRCSFEPQDTDGSLLLVEASCGEKNTMYALDPASGDSRWENSSGSRTRHAWTQDGVTLLSTLTANTSNVSTLVAPDGKRLWELKGKELTAKEMAVTGGRAVLTVADHDRGFGRRIEIVDVRTGKVLKRADAREHASLAAAGGRVYGVRQWLGEREDYALGVEPELVPGGLDVIDPGNGRVTTVPLPFAVVDHEGGLGSTPISGDRLFHVQVSGKSLRLAGYGPGEPRRPVETGGVAPADWPDACELTARASEVTAREPVSRKPLRLGSVRIPGWTCEVRSGGGRPFEFRIGWVAPTPEAAAALLDGVGGQKVPGVGDDAYLDRIETGPALRMRTGRYIVVFDDADLTRGSFKRSVIDAVGQALRGR